jgi:hypothetical protein
MQPYDSLSCEQLFAIHDRHMEAVSDCLMRSGRLMRESRRHSPAERSRHLDDKRHRP